MNITLIILEMIITLTFILVLYKKNKYEGLYLYSIVAYILSIIVSVKNIELLTVEIPLGIILTTSIYITSNILVQDKGLESIKKLIKLLSLTGVITVTVLLLTSSMTVSDISVIPNTYSLMFINKIRIVITTAIVPLIVLWLNANMYYQLKREKNNLMISNFFTALIIYFIDACILSLLSFVITLPLNEIFIIISVIYVIKISMGILGIPISYIVRNMKDKK